MLKSPIFRSVVAFSLLVAPSCNTLAEMVEPRGSTEGGTPKPTLLTTVVGIGGVAGGLVALARGDEKTAAWIAGITAGVVIAAEANAAVVRIRRAKYAKESEFLDAEIATAKKSVAEKKSLLATLGADTVRQRQRVERLELAAQTNALSKVEAEAQLVELTALNARTQEELTIAEAEVEVLAEAVKTSAEMLDPSVTDESLQERRAQLTIKRDQKLGQYKLALGMLEEQVDLGERLAALN